MSLLQSGAKAPDFTTTDQNGNKVALKDYRGKKVVQLGVEVLGVSVDTEKSHKSFADKFKLPFTLLADTDKKIVNAYGAWGEKSMYGRKYMGTHRVTYLINEAGRIAAVFPKVKPEEHAEEILAQVKLLK
jgi:peroxiredoxin Q/BCP